MRAAFHRLIAAWSLLVAMAFVVTPASMWHHHDGARAHVHPEGGATVENVCPVCDHALPIAVQQRVAGVSCTVFVLGLEGPGHLPLVDVGLVLGHADRGPPALG